MLRAIPALKERLQINVELASPDQFIPVPRGWEERSPIISRIGRVTLAETARLGARLAMWSLWSLSVAVGKRGVRIELMLRARALRVFAVVVPAACSAHNYN